MYQIISHACALDEASLKSEAWGPVWEQCGDNVGQCGANVWSVWAQCVAGVGPV